MDSSRLWRLRAWVSAALVALSLVVGASAAFAGDAPAASTGSDRPLLIATTTSLQESGLLDVLIPPFEKASGQTCRVIAVGSGAALEMARRGDADVVLAHSPAAEAVLVDDGIATRRTQIMENHFVIVGPKADPAGVASASSPEDAIARILRSKATFVSRDDQSGTHAREQQLMKAAGFDPAARSPGILRTGTGMGPSLLVAGEKGAYVLSDIGTYLAFRDRIGLVVLSKPAPSLRNVYSILQLDPEKFDHPIASEGAEALEKYLLSPDVQAKIGAFGRDRFGESLFQPLRSAPRP